ncbi:MAG: cytochrome c [Hyphomicrobiaceae bacterium]|nr:cytochrome c [Hyphomicrobiaceae bacterium]
MLRTVAGLLVVTLAASVAQAQNLDAIKQRQNLMKANAEATKAPTAMMKGEAPFDLAKVKTSLKTFQTNAVKLKTLWPADSKTGGDTKALPAIWTNMKDYLDWFDGFAKDSKAAEAAIKDEATFKTEWPKVVNYCGSCHKDYRVAKK